MNFGTFPKCIKGMYTIKPAKMKMAAYKYCIFGFSIIGATIR